MFGLIHTFKMNLAKLQSPTIFHLIQRFQSKETGFIIKTNIRQFTNEVRMLPKFLKTQTTRQPNYFNTYKKLFHTSKPKNSLSPIVWAIIWPVFHAAAMITGRSLRVWWSKLTPSQKLHYLREYQKNQVLIAYLSVVPVTIMSVFYLTHIEESPITKRKRFMFFSEKQILEIANLESNAIMKMFKDHIITSGYHYDHALKITRRILDANRNIIETQRKWRVVIINKDELKNAFVLMSGHIFIFTGVTEFTSNDDQFAVIIGHEMAHALLSHSSEIASKAQIWEMTMTLPILAIWTLLPLSLAFPCHILIEYLATVLLYLPLSRQLESEADVVGLAMISKACFDPREAKAFWKKLDELATTKSMEWMSTHPSHKARYQALDEFMPKAMEIFFRHCSK